MLLKPLLLILLKPFITDFAEAFTTSDFAGAFTYYWFR